MKPKSILVLDIDFLNYSLWYYPFLPLTTGTTGRKKLTKQALLKAGYLLPPLEQQKEIISKIETRLSEADYLEKSIKESLLKAEALRQSILKRAFEGKLVSSEPVVMAESPPVNMPSQPAKKHPQYTIPF